MCALPRRRCLEAGVARRLDKLLRRAPLNDLSGRATPASKQNGAPPARQRLYISLISSYNTRDPGESFAEGGLCPFARFSYSQPRLRSL